MRRMPAVPVHRTGPGGTGAAVSPGCMVKKSVMGHLMVVMRDQDPLPGSIVAFALMPHNGTC
jgi:hypothetical protein